MASIIARILLLLSACNVCAAETSSWSRAAHPDGSVWAWGPYRPNLYFGIRPAKPETFLMGLMWANGDDQTSMLRTLRDTCEQDDGMEGYGWTAYDVRLGGIQTIHDSVLHLDLTTEFFKTSDGLSWSVRVKGEPRADAPANLNTTLIFHFALENAQNSTEERGARCDYTKEGKFKGVSCAAMVPEFGPVDIYQQGSPKNNIVQGPAMKSLTVAEDKIWQAKTIFKDVINSAGRNTMIVDEGRVGNMHFSQLVLEGPFSVTFAFRSDAGTVLDSNTIESLSQRFRGYFSSTVDEIFPRAEPYRDDKYSNFTGSLVANLLGGLGFFYGDQKVDYSYAPEYEENDLKFWEKSASAMARAEVTTTKKSSLFSHTPSRPFFPRGFLWDEGFHLLPVVEWDLGLAVLVLKKWLMLMDDDGWIAREQILGPEARSKVPKEFQTQYPHHANPPAFFLLLNHIISKVTGQTPYNGTPSKYIKSSTEAKLMMKELFPLLDRHYNWFRRTQAGNLTAYSRPSGASPEGYRWKGRAPGHTFASGLDDYPRAEPPHPGELHVDALAWVGSSARALRQVADYLGEDSTIYTKQLDDVLHNLEVLHWSSKHSAYCDSTIGSNGQYQHVCHLGYTSLMPLLLGHMNASHPHLPAMLDLVQDADKLWSPHGLRSLSAADPLYGTDEDYWRGAVWMNLNVLAVQRLHAMANATAAGVRARQIAAALRRRVVDTVFASWASTGFVWEQYNDRTGAGQHSRAFTGWTACVVLLMGLEDAPLPATGGGDAATPAAGASGGLAVVPAVLVFVLVTGLVVFRRRVVDVCRGLVARCSALYPGCRGVGGSRAPEYQALNLDDLAESDTEGDIEADNPLR